MKIAVYGKTPESKAQLKREIKKFGFEHDEKHPEIVLSYGGDGTFLWAERAYPGIPKALFRHSNICKKCHDLPIDHALELIIKRKYNIQEHRKLESAVQGRKLTATNDIVMRNKEPTHAIRFTMDIDGKRVNGELIGDGIVAATPFGSSGYFHSITRNTFETGIGVAFNNTTIAREHLILPHTSKIKLTVTRGEAVVAADNNPKMLILKEGRTITIKTSRQKARILTF